MSDTRARRLQPVTASSNRGNRWAWFASGIGATGLLAIAGVVLFAGGPPPEDPTPLPAADVVAAESEEDVSQDAEAAAEASTERVALPLATFQLALARDPFEPVVPEEEPAGSDPADPSDPSSPSDPSDPSSPSDPSDPGAGADGTCTSGYEVVCDGRVITVISVSELNGEPTAVVQVDTMRYDVFEGDTFADDFWVLSISPDEVRLLYGERVVRILVGDNALK